MLTQTEAKGIDIMGNTDLQGTSKRVRIVLCMLVVLGVTAAVPAAGLAADWSSHTPSRPRTGRARSVDTIAAPSEAAAILDSSK